MIHRMYFVAFVALMALPAGAQDRGVLAIDEAAGRYAFSFDSKADALNMCGTAGCKVVAAFSACLAVAYSRVMIQQEQSVWTWIEADTEGTAGREALDECERSGGAACEVLNVYCAAAPATSRAASTAGQQPATATPEQETVFWQSIVDSTNPTMFEAYLEQFPNGVFRALAQVRLAELRAPVGDRPAADGPRGGGAAAPATAVGRIASTPPDAPAQRLLEIDGIELLGKAQLVMSGGGTCNVLESDTAYEARRENDGAPMDIWQLDFSVRNGSGRWLDHLIARFQIESEWPECTNWDGPDAGTFQPLEWSDSIDFIQESGRNVVGPDETLTETKYFIVLQGDPEPRFTNWSVDFDFAVNPPPAGTAAVASGSRSAQPPVAATPELEGLFWQSIMNSANPAVFEAYMEQFSNGVFRALVGARGGGAG